MSSDFECFAQLVGLNVLEVTFFIRLMICLLIEIEIGISNCILWSINLETLIKMELFGGSF